MLVAIGLVYALTAVCAVHLGKNRRWQSPSSSLGPVVDLGYAAFIGNSSLSSVHFFGGIPYIQPPLGDLRWRAPKQLDETPKDGDAKPLHDARNFGPICIQQPAIVGVGDEDCVTLNVWKPAGAKDGDNLPVVIYIHGGGNYYNQSAQGFPMQDWVNITNGGIVAVNIQYRLGLLGFLASSTIMSDGVANAGLQDQRAAFEWVQRHISSFGGDPTHVTISGQSSGGGSVLNHLVWKGGETPPFQAAILQSIGNDPFHGPEIYEPCFQNVVNFVGCQGSQDVMSCLRNTSVRVLISAVNHRPQPQCKYLPIIDGQTILDYPSRSLTQGKFAKVPVMAGHTTDDGTTFAGSNTSVVNATTLYTGITSSRYFNLTYATFERGLALYNQSQFTSFYDLAQTLAGETEFTCWDWYLANQTANYGKPSYLYRWNTPDPVQLAAAPYKGVMHTSELYFLFDGTNSGVSSSQATNTFKPFNSTEAPLAREAVSYWTSFARSYDPSTSKASGSPSWPAVGAGGNNVNGKRIVPMEGSANGTATTVENIDDGYVQRCL
ncbi:hypothetical protein EHS25_007569 [Saitozyma podzolica]|uniref:Carboxylic ester hydrolase n=1 Tax=Saitozyma podzolica TaxID=1890683 RepID=A0A427YQ68_9TREE|nr:hypothetical protein EHS25_007569 [Saitozyma podzolica]